MSAAYEALAAQNRGPVLVGVAAVFLALAWIVVPLRVYVRLRLTKSFALDDWFAVVTLIFFTLFSIFAFFGAYWGAGRHMFALTVHQMMMAMKYWWWAEILYVLVTTTLRLTVGTFLLRIAVKKSHRQALHILNFCNILFNLYYICFGFLQCFPLSYFWTRVDGVSKGRCLSEMSVKSSYVQCALMAVLDYSFGSLPVLIIWDLQMSMRRKVLVGLILGLGVFASTGTIVRLFYVHTLANDPDFLWATINVAIWSFVEPGLGIFCICLATLRPLFRNMFTKFGISASDSNEQGIDNSPRFRRHYLRPEDAEMQLTGIPSTMGSSNKIESSPSYMQQARLVKGKNGRITVSVTEATSSSDDEAGITRTTELAAWAGDQAHQCYDENEQQPQKQSCQACRWCGRGPR